MTEHAARPEFVILTGALGSGKTTLLQHFMQTPEAADTGVMVNDAGEYNVDGAILSRDARGLPVTQLANGCICCAVGADLAGAVDQLLRARAQAGGGPLKQIILETSGLAEPGPILRALRGLARQTFDLRVVATFDAARDVYASDPLPEYLAQLAAAGAIALTKLDAACVNADASAERARSFNPLARVIAVTDPDARARAALAPGATHGDVDAPPPPRFACHPAVTVVNATWADPPDWAEIEDWLENIAAFCGARLLRAKGVIQPADMNAPILLSAVGDCFAPPQRLRQAPLTEPGKLFLILRDMDLTELRSFSASVCDRGPDLSAGQTGRTA